MFTDKDQGWGKLYTSFTVEKKNFVFVGYLNSSGEYKPKSKTKSGKQPEPITMATLAAIHEFGAPNSGIPERSFMRSAMTSHETEIQKVINKVLLQIIDHRITTKTALGIVAERVKAFMQGMIRKGLSPALKRRKGKPLWDTGQLINSISWEVSEGE